MANRRRSDGDETWNRLREWTKGQKAAERLACYILHSDGYTSLDPSHPLGGRDGLKDLICQKRDRRWIGAAYFPRSQQDFKQIKEKFEHDLSGVRANCVEGIAFVTNQELTLSERRILMELGEEYSVDIFHLERTAHTLNTPSNYGVRLEFLDIELSKEEQLSYFAERDKTIDNINDNLERLAQYISFKEENVEQDYELEKRTQKEILDAIDEFLSKVWFDRHMVLRTRVRKGTEKVDPEILKGALKAARTVVKRYGIENLGPWSDFEWGMLNGKLSALRWVLGDDWDMLDT